MTISPLSSLPTLLIQRAHNPRAELGYLNDDGTVRKSSTYAQLLADARCAALRLLSFGLKAEDVVIICLPDHESSIRLFWACCLAGIPVCPIPPLHPDVTRQRLFFEHLDVLLHKPTLITDEATSISVKGVAPQLRSITLAELDRAPINSDKQHAIYPNRFPKSDDIACLMLTSGSTGNCKAVALSHSNLLSSISGKIRHHGTTPDSRFLNWIAFDHVACVSEIHLQALFADASQYHISASAVIRNPRILLTLCSQLRVSYSFSPNFLLAQICRSVSESPFDEGSLDLSRLVAVISGGESVPTNIAISFANIIEHFGARRDVLRAGFGMTETGAGCIYDVRPIPRDTSSNAGKYLSLGKCCPGVTARVINTSDGSLCKPMQEGQLQVSGPTVFRKYYNDIQATNASFTSIGWFITGDIAIVDLDGNISLTAREKDCLNINGVKYPTLDIERDVDSAEIDGILKASIYVCPMRLPGAPSETYGVFYQHQIPVDGPLNNDELVRIVATNRAIKAASTISCGQTPHVVLPLPSPFFVKTALGKVSRSALSGAYLKGTCSSLEQQLSVAQSRSDNTEDGPSGDIEHAVFDVVSSVFNIPSSSLHRSLNLFDFGASSLDLMRLKQLLQERLSVSDLPTIGLLKHPELGPLCDYLSLLATSRSKGMSSSYDPLVCLHSEGSQPPLFLIHPGVGEILVFINLARVLNDDRPVYALRARGFDNDDKAFSSLDEMAESYTAAIKARYPQGPYYIAGYSFGGAVAFEVTKKLESEGRTVAWLGIMNLPPHIQFRMHELVWLEVMINLCVFLSLFPDGESGSMIAQVQGHFPELRSSDSEPSCATDVIKWVFDHSDQARLDALQLKLPDFERWIRVAYDISCTGRSYEPSGSVRGALTTIFCAIPLHSMGTREEFKADRLSKWADFCQGPYEMVDVDGEHYTMLSETHVSSFAEKLRGAIGRSQLPKDSAIPRPKLDFDAIPIIDFSLYSSDKGKYFQQMQYALEDVGFGILVNAPGFEDTFQKELFSLADQLFNKPQEWRDALGTSTSYSLRGYFRADTIQGHHKAFAEAYRFGLEMPSPPADAPFWLRLHEGPNQWPREDDLPRFRSMMETLFQQYRNLNITLNEHVCQLLNIPNKVLNDFFPSKAEFNSAIWHYFPVSPEILSEARDGFLQGMHEHRDPSTFLTCLIQSRAGLQAKNHAGTWVDVPMVPGGVVFNIGMQLMKLTGGKFCRDNAPREHA
ncbi:hypothetical protein EW026_g1235 [Hermanssonia centrifuga]|uniref:Carrier domain-containing protein n=1 Tax=Hermanssonia centrifuga TaxID=98765 RepID=A0A4S4KT18_9APHY|nr:hypothetical protein EW026_g1235 [Hermanssonia centrifuga]